MKKSKLCQFNKSHVKVVLAGAGLGTILFWGCINDFKNNNKRFAIHKEKLKQREAKSHAMNQSMDDTNANQAKAVSKKTPYIAILYHEDGKIAIMVDHEYLSLEAATQKYPELTANIREYIAKTHGTTTNTESGLEK